jgi:hypothetical protein
MFIYIVTNKVNGKKYIGKTINSVETRWKQHVNTAKCGGGYLFHNAIRKHGQDSFKVEKHNYTGLVTERELLEIEQDEILRHRAYINFNGYNILFGNHGESHKSTKRVKQYDLQTLNIIKIWGSIKEAIETTGISGISSCCTGACKSSGDFGWCYIDEDPIPYTKNTFQKKVNQYDLNLNLIKTWGSIKEAEKNLNIFGISANCRKVTKSAGGFIWCFINNIPDLYTNNSNCNVIKKKIKQYDLKTLDIIKVWSSVASAEKELNINSISKCCKRKGFSAGGFGWCYVEDSPTPYNNNKGKHNMKRVLQLHKKTKDIINIFKSASEAGRILNISNVSISMCCRNITKSAGGFGWRYA